MEFATCSDPMPPAAAAAAAAAVVAPAAAHQTMPCEPETAWKDPSTIWTLLGRGSGGLLSSLLGEDTAM